MRWSGWQKYMESLAIMLGSIISISAELFIYTAKHQPFADDWSIPDNHLNNVKHSTMSLLFFIFGTSPYIPHGFFHLTNKATSRMDRGRR
ncbi:hypothetical protein R1flu_020624 [Riccia fluitans]|uniref:Uncharacterized protein n=1 Tax=Riccia fluitans TaxID=41844 RepID=A0ABD1ZNN9_9MARC